MKLFNDLILKKQSNNTEERKVESNSICTDSESNKWPSESNKDKSYINKQNGLSDLIVPDEKLNLNLSDRNELNLQLDGL